MPFLSIQSSFMSLFEMRGRVCLESKAKVILELGLGHNENVLKPSCVKVLKPDKVLAVACGKTHTVVGMISGRVF